MPPATALSQAALKSAQVLGSSVTPTASIAALLPQIQLMRWMFIGAATQCPSGFITGSSSGATTLSQPSAAASSSMLAVMPVCVPLGDFRTLELHRGGGVARDHVGAQLGEGVGGVAGDRGLLPGTARGGEHLAELGDRGGVVAGWPTDAASALLARRRPSWTAAQAMPLRGPRGPSYEVSWYSLPVCPLNTGHLCFRLDGGFPPPPPNLF